MQYYGKDRKIKSQWSFRGDSLKAFKGAFNKRFICSGGLFVAVIFPSCRFEAKRSRQDYFIAIGFECFTNRAPRCKGPYISAVSKKRVAPCSITACVGLIIAFLSGSGK
jgi:hypothetical protein